MKFYDENEEKIEQNVEKEKTEIKTEQKINTKKQKKVMILIISVSILLVLMIICTGFSLLNINNKKMLSGVSIDGLDVKGLTEEGAIQKLTEEKQEILNKDIICKVDEFEYSIKPSQIEIEYNIKKAVKSAYDVGRSSNIFVNNFNIIKAMLLGTDIPIDYTYNEQLLDEIVSDIASKVPNAVINTDYYIEDAKLIITKGTPGNSIDKGKTKNEIIDNIKNNINKEILLDLIQVEPNQIDIDKIYSEIYTEPKDAYYTKEPFEIFPHVNGVNFDIEAARELLKEEKDVYIIELIIKEPEITTNEIGTEAFPDLLSSFSTKYDASNVPRTTNLKLAMQKLDGVVVNSGEEFSYNKTLGKRTAEAGYREAGGYAGGRVVQTLAGGICQISSTLYDAIVYANLEVTERHNHMFLAGYVGAGKDATVVYGAYDLKFKNTRKYPIMLKTTIGGGVAKIDVYGIKEEVEYEIEISTKILSYIPFSVKYETDNSLAPGAEKVVQKGMNGAKSITYKIVKLNGAQISSTVLSTDTYDPMHKIIKRGAAEETMPIVPTEQSAPITPVEQEQAQETNTKPSEETPNEENNQNSVQVSIPETIVNNSVPPIN
ncbi:MAG: VanW family protein [Clostridia bacterium]|nr:VanW family protein [Clostridia bacterium]